MCRHHPGEPSRRQLGLHERQVFVPRRHVCAGGRDQSGGGDQESGVRVGFPSERDGGVEQDGSWAMGE